MTNSFPLHTFDLSPDVRVAYLGPHLDFGPLPALFYFALSAEDSLCLDPFNQPAAYLSSLPMRVFSLTLPGHENQLPPTQALYQWAHQIAEGHNVIAHFVAQIKLAVHALSSLNTLIPERIAVAGLSRGAFIATHAAAEIPEFRWILGFAPLTRLSFAKEFQEIPSHPLVQGLALETLTERLVDRHLRFYIGNLDTRVSTRLCFEFIEKLTQTAVEQRIRSPQTELIITPSIGRDGHGTSKEIFHQGAQWIAEQLGAIDVL
jgi:predicted esterase